MDVFAQAAERIIKEQESIIGPVALEQAKKVPGLTLDWEKKEVSLQGDEKTVLEQLVEQYKALFGQASVDVCKHAVKGLISTFPQNKIPSLLL